MTDRAVSPAVVEAIDDGVPALRAFRVDTEISVGELAEDSGIAPERIDAIEDGAAPAPEEILAIAEALHVPPTLLAED